MSFFEYMLRYLKKDTPEGDLARDMPRDRHNFPYYVSAKVIKQYLISNRACDNAIDTFEKCYKRYKNYCLRHSRTTSSTREAYE